MTRWYEAKVSTRRSQVYGVLLKLGLGLRLHRKTHSSQRIAMRTVQAIRTGHYQERDRLAELQEAISAVLLFCRFLYRV